MAEERDGAVVDWSGPLAQVAGDAEVLRDIVEAYVEEIRENLELLPRSLADASWTDARRQAHTVKGAMRMFGVAEGVRSGQALEDAAVGQLAGCEAFYADLKRSAEAALPELESFAKTGALPTAAAARKAGLG